MKRLSSLVAICSLVSLSVLAPCAWLAGSTSALAQADPAPAAPADQGSRLQGVARIDRYDRVVGAVVTVRPEDDASRFYMTSTDAKGAFQVDGLPNGDYVVQLERSGFATVVKDRIGLKFPFRAVVELTMEPSEEPAELLRQASNVTGSGKTITLEGSTMQRDGGALGEVRVRLVHPDGQRDPRQVESDADGSFRIDDLAAGDWILAVNGVGLLPLRVRVDLQQDSSLEVSLVRQPADYEPSPLELMPPEQPAPPPGFLEGAQPQPAEAEQAQTGTATDPDGAKLVSENQ